jgi:hypothetical protein
MEVASQSCSFLLVKNGKVSGDVFSDCFDFSEFGSAS